MIEEDRIDNIRESAYIGGYQEALEPLMTQEGIAAWIVAQAVHGVDGCARERIRAITAYLGDVIGYVQDIVDAEMSICREEDRLN